MRPTLIALALLAASPAAAQLVLPGAVAPTPEGAVEAPASPSTPARPRPKRRAAPDAALDAAAPAPSRVLPAATLAGQTLYRGGRGSLIAFEMRDRALVVTRLTLVGQTEDGAECRVDVADMPLAVRDEGRAGGMARVGVPVPACPLSFDVLDGAALQTGDRDACTFAATRCRIDPSGLWGAPPAALTPERDKLIERQRARAEAAVRAEFRRLTKGNRDRPAVMGDAREQAQFSSTREEMCRGYAGEASHGYCATRLTEARAAALRARADAAQADKAARKRRGVGKG